MKHYVNDNWKCYGFLIRNYGGQKIVEHIENGKRKECQSRTLETAKISFRNEGEIKSLTGGKKKTN